ncbi:MAG: cytochrome c biogenesis protein CcsA [Flavobacteriales bacterium]
MKGWWWKLGSVALLMYVVIIGLRTPLRPALVHASATRIEPGEASFEVTGYNTRFATSQYVAWWLENGEARWCATSVAPMSETRVRLSFVVPDRLPRDMTSIATFNSLDGELRLPEALWTVRKGGSAGTLDASCVPANTNSAHLFAFPDRNILNESIRNLFFHVPMWFAMMLLMTISVVQSIITLRNNSLGADLMADTAVRVSLLFAALGLITGSLWARVTWGGWWTSDTKLNGAAVTVLIYAAYLVLRGSVPDPHKRARLAAVYNVFAYVLMMVFIMVLPRVTDSLHPGNGGNPAFSNYDLDSSLRAVFYPACMGWIGLAYWAFRLRVRTARLSLG